MMERLTKKERKVLAMADASAKQAERELELLKTIKKLADELEAVSCRLAYYEDLEEQGRLITLPCKVGDTVYEVQPIRKRVQPLEIISAYIGRMGELFFYWELKDGIGIYQNVKGFGASQLGKTVFLTRELAEEALGGAENV